MTTLVEHLRSRFWFYVSIFLITFVIGFFFWRPDEAPKTGDPCYLGRGIPLGHLERGANGGLVCVVRFE